jgi:hypothetical protein
MKSSAIAVMKSRVYTNLSNSPDQSTTTTPPPAIKWIHVADASLRIEAIISGQAVVHPAENFTQTVAVQPASDMCTALSDPAIIPIPHSIVVIKQETSYTTPQRNEFSRQKRENRSHRAGRLSRQIISGNRTRQHNHQFYSLDNCCCCQSQLFPEFAACGSPFLSCFGIFFRPRQVSHPHSVRVGLPVMC